MKQQEIPTDQDIWDDEKQAFKIPYPLQGKEQHTKQIKESLQHYFTQYKKIQEKLCLKFPYCSQFQVAKIKEISQDGMDSNFLYIQFEYDALNGSKEEIIYQYQFEPISEGFKKATPLTCHFGNDLKTLDVFAIKQVVQCLIESLHWSANYGLFLDPFDQNLLLFKQQDSDFYVFIPTFNLITNYLFEERIEFSWQKFDTFRISHYQNATNIFFSKLVQEFKHIIKEHDEDQQLYKKLSPVDRLPQMKNLFSIGEIWFGVDDLYSDDYVRKKMWRYTFKQSMILYQLQDNEQLRNSFKFHKNKDSDIVKKGKESIGEPQTENLKSFISSLSQVTSVSNDIMTSFGQKMLKEYLCIAPKYKDEANKIRAAFRPRYKPFNNKHEMKLQQNIGQQQKQQMQQEGGGPEQNNNKQQEYSWISDINQLNIIYPYITHSSTTGPNGKQLNIKYKFELLESKQCYIFRTVIPEIVFSIDSADDILFLVNYLQKETGTTNLYVDDNRRLTLYTSIVMGQRVEIIPAVLKILDLHQIYFYLILEFYSKNIQTGRSIKEAKYNHFAREISHYVQDYEKDFDDQMKNIMSNQEVLQGF